MNNYVKPQLVVILKTNSQEAALWACKDTTHATGSLYLKNGCYSNYAGAYCAKCSSAAGS